MAKTEVSKKVSKTDKSKTKPKADKSKTKTKKDSKTKTKKSGSKSGKKSDVKKRSFTLIDEKNGEKIGRYKGATPKQAGLKSFSKLIKRSKDAGKKVPTSTNIYIMETTRGSRSRGKVYGYKATRNKLKKAERVAIKDKETGKPIIDEKTGKPKIIPYEFKNDAKKIPVPEALQMGGRKKKAEKAKKKAGTKTKKAGTKKTTKPKAKKTGSKAKKTANKPKSSKTEKKSKK